MNKVDMINPDLGKKIELVFKSKSVRDKVESVAEYMGFANGYVLPMKNYTDDQYTETNINILALRNLIQILHSCDDTLQNFVKGWFIYNEGIIPR